jgi:phosphatidylglycerol:prolipoprotein diacylglycerol transferase
MMYGFWVALGVVIATLSLRLTPSREDLGATDRRAVLWAAALGSIAGAYLLQLPADRFGWAEAGHSGQNVPLLGGRTVLGGLLGGWLTVEAVKWRRGIRTATGDRFVVPLAASLAFGRIGCATTGCCGAPWVPLIEAYFHALMAVLGVFAMYRGTFPGARLAAYVTIYALLRIGLEELRPNPVLALGLTYYQWLAVALLSIAAPTWYRRALCRRKPPLNAAAEN